MRYNTVLFKGTAGNQIPRGFRAETRRAKQYVTRGINGVHYHDLCKTSRAQMYWCVSVCGRVLIQFANPEYILYTYIMYIFNENRIIAGQALVSFSSHYCRKRNFAFATDAEYII